jgi:hypothetical protein
MAIVVGLAAGILGILDRVTLGRNLSDAERKATVRKRTRRWQRAWFSLYVVLAAIALVVHGFNLEHESLRARVAWSAAAAAVIVFFLLSKNEEEQDRK